jgi:choice-of-anchor C domain-containing protein
MHGSYPQTLVRLTATLSLLAAGASAHAAAFTNGSFEAGSVNPGSGYITLGTGSAAITGWNVASGTVDYIGTFWQATDGNRSVDLDGGSQGSLQQTFETASGATYEVLFDLAGNYVPNPVTKTLRVSAGSDSAEYTFSVAGKTAADMGYVGKSFTFTAVGASTTLTFASLTAGAYGPAIDNVRVSEINQPVPEPSTYALMLAGLAAVGYAARRRRT